MDLNNLFPPLPDSLNWHRLLIADLLNYSLLPRDPQPRGKRLSKTIKIPNTQSFREKMALDLVNLKERPWYDIRDYLHLIPPELVFLRRNYRNYTPMEDRFALQKELVESCITTNVDIETWINHYNAVHNVWNSYYHFRASSVFDKPFGPLNKHNDIRWIPNKNRTNPKYHTRAEFIESRDLFTKEVFERHFLIHPFMADVLVTKQPRMLEKYFYWTVKRLPKDTQNTYIRRFNFLVGREFAS